MKRLSPGSSNGGGGALCSFSRVLLGLVVVTMGYYYTVFHADQQETVRYSSEIKSLNLRSSSSNGSGDGYRPSYLETYMLRNSKALGYDLETANGCVIWKEDTNSTIYDDLHLYKKELDEYNRLVDQYPGPGVKDVRLHLDEGICDRLEVKKGGLQNAFHPGTLSRAGDAGFVEPMLPPMRHPGICVDYKGYLMNMGYLIHDFGAMCRKLKRHSRTVFVDMGAALDFHLKEGKGVTPAVYVTHMYQRFGIKFDHIYAYELRPKDPADVYERIPDDLRAAYHWFNVGVDSDPNSRNNPLKMIKENFNEDDFIVVKLDIDTSSIEVPLAHSFLSDQKLMDLVDVLYFEHHVHMLPVLLNWGYQSVDGSLEDSLKLFTDIRKKGIAAHSWP